MAKSRVKRTTTKSKKPQAFRRRAPAATAAPTFPEPAAPVATEVPSEVQPRPAPTKEEIRALAYQLYAERRGEPGRRVDDWLEAERMLRAG